MPKKKHPQKLLRKTSNPLFSLLPELPKWPKQKNLCSKMWLIDQLYIKWGYVSAFNLNKCYHETNNWTKCNRRCPFPWDSKVLVGFFEAQTCLYSYTLVTKNREKIILIFLDDVSDSGLGSFASLGSNYLKLRPLQTMSDLADLGMQSLRPNFSLMSNLRKR